MQANWHAVSNKSNTAQDVIDMLRKSEGLAFSMKAQMNSLAEVANTKKARQEALERERIEADRAVREKSEAARALAAELTADRQTELSLMPRVPSRLEKK